MPLCPQNRIDAHVHDQLSKHIDIVDVRFQQTKIIRVNREEERRVTCRHRYGKDDEQSNGYGSGFPHEIADKSVSMIGLHELFEGMFASRQ